MSEVVIDAVAAPSAGRRRSDSAFGLLHRAALAWLVLIAIVALVGPLLPFPDPNRIGPTDKYLPLFSDGHILGTDQLGRDLLARLAHGTRVSMLVAAVTVVVGIGVGGLAGTTIGYLGGRIESVAIGAINVALSFPGLLLLLGVIAMVGQSLTVLIVVFSILAIPPYTRFARGATLSLREREWVRASEGIGSTPRRVVMRVLLPEVLTTLVPFAILAVGGVIIAEGAVAFLGFGVPPPNATWGGMVADGNRAFSDDVIHVALVPATAMFLTILSLNLVGDAARRRLDTRTSKI